MRTIDRAEFELAEAEVTQVTSKKYYHLALALEFALKALIVSAKQIPAQTNNITVLYMQYLICEYPSDIQIDFCSEAVNTWRTCEYVQDVREYCMIRASVQRLINLWYKEEGDY